MALVKKHPDLSKVIVALDYESPVQAFSLVETLGDLIDWYKVGPMLFTKSGHEAVTGLRKRNKKVFVDLKLHDTPAVVANTVKQIAELGVDYLTVHVMGGMEMLLSAAEYCRGSRLRLVGVTLLTSQTSKETKQLGWNHSEQEIVLNLLGIALESRLAGIMCSPHEIEKVRPKTLPGFQLFAPGIRLRGQEVFQDDQKRFASPTEALKWGADYIIIGRPITTSPHPRNVVEGLFA